MCNDYLGELRLDGGAVDVVVVEKGTNALRRLKVVLEGGEADVHCRDDPLADQSPDVELVHGHDAINLKGILPNRHNLMLPTFSKSVLIFSI